jgi:hypothetical protein
MQSHNKKSDTIAETLEVIEYNLERGLYVRHAQTKILFEEFKKLKMIYVRLSDLFSFIIFVSLLAFLIHIFILLDKPRAQNERVLDEKTILLF